MTLSFSFNCCLLFSFYLLPVAEVVIGTEWYGSAVGQKLVHTAFHQAFEVKVMLVHKTVHLYHEETLT